MKNPKQPSDIKFKLLKDMGRFKKGMTLNTFGGLVSGVDGISFLNTEYFEIVKARKKHERK
jgi:hypothetical protein